MFKIIAPYTMQIDNFFTEKECKKIISTYKKQTLDKELNSYLNYKYFDIKPDKYWGDKILNLIKNYSDQYDGINAIEQWAIDSIRFKHFPKNYALDKWHCEHVKEYPYRIISFLIYLSDHDTGTEFYHDKITVKSKVGRVIIFPSSWTHLHRGQKTNKDRYILSFYSYLKI